MKTKLSKCCNTEVIELDGKIYCRHCGEEVKNEEENRCFECGK